MDNVPSSAIMAIIAIIVACALGTFIFASMQSQKEAGNLVTNKVEGVSSNITESDLSQYDGKTVTGADVRSAIKLFKDQQLMIEVEDHGHYNYMLSTSSWYDASTGQSGKSMKFDKIVEGTAGNGEISESDGRYAKVSSKKTNKSYIDPTEYYVGDVVKDNDNGEVIELRFTKKNKGS